jgi:hypothetical protein
VGYEKEAGPNVQAAARDAAPFPPLPQPVRDRADVPVITFQFPDT